MKLKILAVVLLMIISTTVFASAENVDTFVCGNYYYTLAEDGSAVITMGFIFEKTLTLPSELDGHPVTGIGDDSFCCMIMPTKITIPDGVKTIGKWAFFECTNLKEIIIPSSVISIDGCAFVECTSLKEIIIPDSVTSIGDGAFESCTSLTKIRIPGSVTSINLFTFRYCTSLKEVIIEDGVTSIGYKVFEGCPKLKKITIPESVTSIDDDAFFGCTGLTITVTKGSYAEQYCIKNKLKYQY